MSIFPDVNMCPFTGEFINSDNYIEDTSNPLLIGYKNRIIGQVSMPHSIYVALKNGKYKENHFIYLGIIRQHFEKYKTPFEVNRKFLELSFKEYSYPKTFKEKGYFFLKHLYDNGGKEYKRFSMRIKNHYPLAYAVDENELNRIFIFLKEEELITSEYEIDFEIDFLSFRLSKKGIKEIEKDYNVPPLIAPIEHEIYTGDLNTDLKIRHAKQLFFKVSSTIEDKRSACITLYLILEPLRKKLENYFSGTDINTFFQIVNDFDVKHNKERTKQLEHVEQIEWIFYTLLNTIITYYKLSNK